MKGITINKKTNKYIVRKSFNGKQLYFGSYDTYSEALAVLNNELQSRGLLDQPALIIDTPPKTYNLWITAIVSLGLIGLFAWAM
jgi:hypothetical protein